MQGFLFHFFSLQNGETLFFLSSWFWVGLSSALVKGDLQNRITVIYVMFQILVTNVTKNSFFFFFAFSFNKGETLLLPFPGFWVGHILCEWCFADQYCCSLCSVSKFQCGDPESDRPSHFCRTTFLRNITVASSSATDRLVSQISMLDNNWWTCTVFVFCYS